MANIFVLKADWSSGKDPVPFYGELPGACLDFNNRRAKPRAKLRKVEEAVAPDCEYGIDYAVVICEVL